MLSEVTLLSVSVTPDFGPGDLMGWVVSATYRLPGGRTLVIPDIAFFTTRTAAEAEAVRLRLRGTPADADATPVEVVVPVELGGEAG